jgi:hypothetical protein
MWYVLGDCRGDCTRTRSRFVRQPAWRIELFSLVKPVKEEHLLQETTWTAAEETMLGMLRDFAKIHSTKPLDE